MWKPHSVCRACGYGPKLGANGIKFDPGSERLIPVFSLGVQPLANDFAGPNEERAGYAPLEVLFCPRCTLAQLSVTVRPDILYSRYNYVTSPSDTMRLHFEALTDALRAEQPTKSCLEIGSNDGAYLRYLAGQSMTTCGIDPADNLAAIARQFGIPTLVGTFNRHTAMDCLANSRAGYDLIVARHVFCHVDDWREFTDCLAIPSRKDTLVAIEVPYVLDLLANGEFDTIYHEHTSYLSLRAMEALLKDSPWRLHKVLRFSIHGGAIVMLLRRKDWGGADIPDISVLDFLENEKITFETWQEFGMKARNNIHSLAAFVANARIEGKTVAGMGASAKSTVWVNACGFKKNDIAFITDTTPQKQWKLSPGSDIPIVDPGAILRELPDYLLCFAWNFRKEVITNNRQYLEHGGKIVFPIPKLEVVGSNYKQA